MIPEVIKRSQYFIPPVNECPHSSQNHYEDWEEFHLPLARTHHAHLHGWGVASGLEVSATPTGTEIEVQPGVAVDGAGELIALSSSGEADIGLLQPGEAGQQIASPFRLNTSGHLGQTRYLSIQFAQILRLAEGSCGKVEQTPWLRLQPTSGAGAYVDDGSSIILAIAEIDAGGVATLRERDATLPHGRRLVGETIAGLRVQRTATVTGTVGQTFAGEVAAGDSGGLRVTVPETGDSVLFEQTSGANFASFTLRANQTMAAGALVVQGAQHNQGDLRVDGAAILLGSVGIGALTPGPRLTIGDGNNGDLLRFNSERPWKFTAGGASANTTLNLQAEVNDKSWQVVAEDGINIPLAVRTNNTSQNNAVYLVQTGGHVGIGTTNPNRHLTVEGGGGTYLNVRGNSGAQEVLLGADAGGGIVSTMTNHDLQLRTGGNATRMTVKADGRVGIGLSNPLALLDVNGDVRLRGLLSIPNTGNGVAVFTHQHYDNEDSFQRNNVKLSMGSRGHFTPIGQPPLRYEFSIGHSASMLAIDPSGGVLIENHFIRRFSINQDGNLYVSGSKSGYVVDYFVNRQGDALETGDVVVISRHAISHYSGAGNNIPIPEVDLTDQAYDSRVCGIVAAVVTEQDLPYVEIVEPPLSAEQQAKATQLVAPPLGRAGNVTATQRSAARHPLHHLAASPTANAVDDKRLGQMVTLGAFAHCKVDADIAPITVGDLLTTSPNKGHAQKANEPARAVGAIIGKALGSLNAGKGKIPVLVMLQ